MGLPSRFTAPFTRFLSSFSLARPAFLTLVPRLFLFFPNVQKRRQYQERKRGNAEERRAAPKSRPARSIFISHARLHTKSGWITIYDGTVRFPGHSLDFTGAQVAEKTLVVRPICSADLHSGSWDMSAHARTRKRERENSLSLFCAPWYAASRWEKKRVTERRRTAPEMDEGTTESENLPPRCRELVACSHGRFRDKIVYELARNRSFEEASWNSRSIWSACITKF